MRLIKLDEKNIVIAVRTNATNIYEGEVKSETGELGQLMQPDGTFTSPEPEPVEPQTTLEDKINYIYYKQMGVI